MEKGLFELGELVGIEFLSGRGEQPILGDRHLPQLGIAHQRDIENRLVLVEELILLQDPQAQALRDRNRALAGFDVAGQHVEERGLAGPIGPHQAVALASVELERYMGEECLLAVELADIG